MRVGHVRVQVQVDDASLQRFNTLMNEARATVDALQRRVVALADTSTRLDKELAHSRSSARLLREENIRLARALGVSEKALQKMALEAGKTGEAMEKGAKGALKMRSGYDGVIATGTKVWMASQTLKSAMNAMTEGAQTIDLRTKLSREVGGFEALLERTKKASAGMVSEEQILRSGALMKGFGIDVSKMDRIMGTLTKTAISTGQSLDYMLDSFARGVARQSPLILDNLGIQVSLQETHARTALALGKSTAALTEQEQVSGLLNEVLSQLENNAKGVGNIAETMSAKVARVSTGFADLWMNIKEGVVVGLVTAGEELANWWSGGEIFYNKLVLASNRASEATGVLGERILYLASLPQTRVRAVLQDVLKANQELQRFVAASLEAQVIAQHMGDSFSFGEDNKDFILTTVRNTMDWGQTMLDEVLAGLDFSSVNESVRKNVIGIVSQFSEVYREQMSNVLKGVDMVTLWDPAKMGAVHEQLRDLARAYRQFAVEEMRAAEARELYAQKARQTMNDALGLTDLAALQGKLILQALDAARQETSEFQVQLQLMHAKNDTEVQLIKLRAVALEQDRLITDALKAQLTIMLPVMRQARLATEQEIARLEKLLEKGRGRGGGARDEGPLTDKKFREDNFDWYWDWYAKRAASNRKKRERAMRIADIVEEADLPKRLEDSLRGGGITDQVKLLEDAQKFAKALEKERIDFDTDPWFAKDREQLALLRERVAVLQDIHDVTAAIGNQASTTAGLMAGMANPGFVTSLGELAKMFETTASAMEKTSDAGGLIDAILPSIESFTKSLIKDQRAQATVLAIMESAAALAQFALGNTGSGFLHAASAALYGLVAGKVISVDKGKAADKGKESSSRGGATDRRELHIHVSGTPLETAAERGAQIHTWMQAARREGFFE